MPFALVALTMGAIAAGSTIAKAGYESEAASSDKERLRLEQKEMLLQTQQRTISNYDTMKKVIATQIAENTVSGTSPISASFNAIQRATVNTFARTQKNINLEKELHEANYDIEKENIDNRLYAQLFGDASNLAFNAFDIYKQMPSAPTSGGNLF